jgi:hypothetical protein
MACPTFVVPRRHCAESQTLFCEFVDASDEAASSAPNRILSRKADNMDVQVDRKLIDNATEIFQDQQFRLHARTDRLFAALMVLQWNGGTIAALLLSPLTWAGAKSEIHPHVYAAVVLGGILAGMPVYLAWRYPGRRVTRNVIAVTQMLFSSLFIHLSGGRIETHFHVFGSLAFLAFYRDWTVLVPATVVVAADHFVRGMFWPESVFGVTVASQWRWVEHAAWVVFEDIFCSLPAIRE